VRFECTQPTASSVCGADTFNVWHRKAKTMHPSVNGHWLKETVLPAGKYEYCLVVDGHWLPDPRAKESVANPFGGRNSVLTVAVSPPEAQPAGPENLPLKKTNQQKTEKYEQTNTIRQ
jgi:hypothetical protein